MELSKQKDKSFTLTLTIPQGDVDQTRRQILTEIQKNFSKDGFRKGNVPIDIIQESISADQLIEEVASKLLSNLYGQKVTQYNLNPIIPPKVKFVTEPGFQQDWVVEISSCELPEVEINKDYQKEISKLNKTNKTTKTDNGEQQINGIFGLIVKLSHVDLPPLLIENEIQHRLSRLVDQTNQAGMTVSQYLQAKNLTMDKYQQFLTSQINQEWQINLSINQIAKDQKIEIDKTELEKHLKSNPQLNGNSSLASFLLLQQKVLNFLKTL